MEDDPGPVDWLDPDLPFLAAGMVSLLGAAPKAGKTTLTRAMVRRLLDAGEGVLAISEEPRTFWRAAFGDDTPGLFLPTERPVCKSEAAWDRLTAEVADEVARRRGSDRPIRLVIFDTIAGVGPIRDENASPEVTRTMGHLRPIAEAGAAVLAIHHTRKPGAGGETHGQAAGAFRGSSAFEASVDILASLSLWSPSNPTGDRRRRLECWGRRITSGGSHGVEIWPEELRYEAFDADGVSSGAIGQMVARLFEGDPSKELTVEQVHAAVNRSAPTSIGKGKVRGVLRGLEQTGQLVQHEPNPRKNHPERYSFRLPGGALETKRIERPGTASADEGAGVPMGTVA